MKIVVADSSSLILATKTAVLEPYAKRVRISVPREAFQEVAAPRLRALYPDALAIARAAERGLLDVRAVRSRRKLPLSLGKGEAAAVRLFVDLEADLVWCDDGRGIRVCRMLEIPFTTTPRVVVDLVALGALSRRQGRHALEKLAVLGRYTREIIAAALAALEEIR